MQARAHIEAYFDGSQAALARLLQILFVAAAGLLASGNAEAAHAWACSAASCPYRATPLEACVDNVAVAISLGYLPAGAQTLYVQRITGSGNPYYAG